MVCRRSPVKKMVWCLSGRDCHTVLLPEHISAAKCTIRGGVCNGLSEANSETQVRAEALNACDTRITNVKQLNLDPDITDPDKNHVWNVREFVTDEFFSACQMQVAMQCHGYL